jgi:hypothetical protein
VASLTATATPTPSASTASPTPTPTKTTSALFGGLTLAAPSTWSATLVPYESLYSADGIDSRYAMDFSPVDSTGNAGLAVEWAPEMTSVDGTQNTNFGAYTKRFSNGAADPTSVYATVGDPNAPDQTATSASAMALANIGGHQAQSWTVHTDVQPDYNHTRTAVHRVWFLPYSHYVLYTYGTLSHAQNAQVDKILSSAQFAKAQLPFDCADAIVYLDGKAAGGSNPAGGDAVDTCENVAMNKGSAGTLGNGAKLAADGSLDPGSLPSHTVAACVALVDDFGNADVAGTDSIDPGTAGLYRAARKQCDLPRKS